MTSSFVEGTPLSVPLRERIELVHAYVQLVADDLGLDVLHLKGAAVDPCLRDGDRVSLDVDVLVRPRHVQALVTELRSRGWTRMTGFEEGSAFGHAMNLRHDLGMIDLHRRWPGFDMDPERAFDLLWENRQVVQLGHVPCTVPDVATQRLILLLHYGRSGGQRAEDRDRSWTEASVEDQAEIRELVETFNAHLAFAAATGGLESFHDDPGYRLWRYFARGSGSRVEEWSARWAAAEGFRQKSDVLVRFLRVNPDLLRLEIKREPTKRDYAVAQVARVYTAAVDVVGLLKRRLESVRGRS